MPIIRPPQTKYSEQNVLNNSYDTQNDVIFVSPVGSDGQNLQRMNASNLQIKRVNDGGYDYFCFSAPGTPAASALWRIFRLDSNANLMFADGNAEYDNAADDPASLNYTYG